MAGTFGVSFVPGQDQQQQPGQSGPGGPAPSPIQSAIKLLSLRLPRVVGANALAPQGLLQAPGGAAMAPQMVGGGNSLEELLRRLFGQQGPSGQPAPGGIPTPHITPGQESPDPWWAIPGPGGGAPLPPNTPMPPPSAPPPRLPSFDPTPLPEYNRANPGMGNRPPGDALRRGPYSGFGADPSGALSRLSRFSGGM